MDAPLVFPLVLVATSVLSVLAAVLIAAAFEGRARSPSAGGGDGTEAVFLIGERSVLDANDAGMALLATLAAQDSSPGETAGPAASWLRLTRHLAPRFPGFTARLTGCNLGAWQIAAEDGSGQVLQAVPANGSLRLVLRHPAAAGERDEVVRLDPLSWRAINDELAALRSATDLSPVPAWRQAADGRIVWANGAYLRLLAESGHSDPLTWPLPALFAIDTASGTRQALTGPTGRQRWFDLETVDEGAGRLVFALAADEAQRAERARRDFVQTLARTFATLPVGLAVFDRTRRLQLFNPALTDLTGLEPEFLASRPGLEGVLNRMRDKHVMPEPRDARSWMRRLLDVEAVASGAGFEETWALADGRSFRVSVAPHPDGALAFLIEDVTSDIRLKRSFRTELDAGRAALDLVDEGVAVFGPSGELVMTNSAFDRLWTLDGADSLAGVRFAEAIASWREAGGDPDLWSRVAELATPSAKLTEVRGTLQLADGEIFALRAKRAPGGGVLLAFAPQQQPVSLTPPPAAAPAALRRALG